MSPSLRPGVNFVDLANGSTLIDARSRPWHSMGLTGEHHEARLLLHGPHAEDQAARLALDLPEHEFRLQGLLVADATVTATHRTPDGVILTLQVLTFDEP